MENLSFNALKADYQRLWSGMTVTKAIETARQARHIMAAKDRYLDVASETNVPWFVLGIIHVREAGDPPDFKAVLHNGQRIVGTGRKTTIVPKGRGPFADWGVAAVDAVKIDHLDQINWYDGWGAAHVAFALEAFNGWGYRLYHNIPSPYLWGGTNRQKSGKYVQDGKYDKSVMDPQIGGMALLSVLMTIDPSVTFDAHPVVASAKAVEIESA